MKVLLIAETNWLTNIVLKQDTASAYLLALRAEGRIDLTVPEYSFYEADGIITEKLRGRQDSIKNFIPLLNEISRSNKYLETCLEIKSKLKSLMSDTKKESQDVNKILDKLKEMISQLPYSEKTSAKAKLRAISSKSPFKLSDCEIYESILDFLREEGREYDNIIFYTADKEDFDHEEIHQELKELNCELHFNSGEVVQRVRVG